MDDQLRVEGVRITCDIRPLNPDDAAWLQGDVEAVRLEAERLMMEALPAGEYVVVLKARRLVA